MVLNDDANWGLARTQRESTPMQRFIYIMSRDAHTPDSAKKDPAGMDKGQEVIKGW